MTTASELDEAALAALTERYIPHAGSTHYDGCELTHSACAVMKLVDEVRRLRERERAWRMQANEMDLAATRANAKLRAARQRIAELETAASRQQEEIQQTLGRALGYPRLADDQGNFPGATDADGVCVGDHVAESLASEAAKRIAELEDALRQIAIAPCMYALLGEPETCQHSCPGCRARKVLGDTATPAAREGE